jgi:hypothetical protein
VSKDPDTVAALLAVLMFFTVLLRSALSMCMQQQTCTGARLQRVLKYTVLLRVVGRQLPFLERL